MEGGEEGVVLSGRLGVSGMEGCGEWAAVGQWGGLGGVLTLLLRMRLSFWLGADREVRGCWVFC